MVEVSRDDLLALVPFKNLDKIIGTPTFENMIILRKQLGANLIAVDCPWGQQKGQLGLLQDPASFTAQNGGAYTPPAIQPPSYPVIPPGTSTSDRERMQASNSADLRDWQIMKHTERIGLKKIAEAVEEVYYAELDDPGVGLNAIDICTLFNHILDRYCAISQHDIDDENVAIQPGNRSKPTACRLMPQARTVPRFCR